MIFLLLVCQIVGAFAAIVILSLSRGASWTALIAFAIPSLLAVIGWYVRSVGRQVTRIAPAAFTLPLVYVFGTFFALLYRIAPVLTLTIVAGGTWAFGLRVGLLIAVGFLVMASILRPTAKVHAGQTLEVARNAASASRHRRRKKTGFRSAATRVALAGFRFFPNQGRALHGAVAR